jgi:hypothetical protein
MSQSTPRSYPRSTPYQTPRETAARESRLWLWTWVLVGSTGVTVFVLVAGGIYVLSGSGKRRADPEKSNTPAPRTWVRDLTPAMIADVEPRPASAPEKPVDPQPEPVKPAAPNLQAERLLEALGGMTAAHLYQTYLNIGLLADSAESEVYTTAEARKLLETLTSLLGTVDRQLSKIAEQDLRPEDRKPLERTRQIVTLLRTQSNELKAYWDTGDKEHTARFHKAREEAWVGIRELLGLPD